MPRAFYNHSASQRHMFHPSTPTINIDTAIDTTCASDGPEVKRNNSASVEHTEFWDDSYPTIARVRHKRADIGMRVLPAWSSGRTFKIRDRGGLERPDTRVMVVPVKNVILGESHRV